VSFEDAAAVPVAAPPPAGRSSWRAVDPNGVTEETPLLVRPLLLSQDETVSGTARRLIGREGELDAIVQLLDAPERLPSAAVLSGEAGIGKTTVWLAGIDAAAGSGYRILSSRPSEAETQFSFAGLTDLLGRVAGDVLPELPPIQQRALEAALLLGESATHADDRAVAAAFLGALRSLARDGPLCLGVDDVQWLDAASLAVLGYALARLDREPVAVLLAVRGDVPRWVRRAVADDRLRTIDVGGLSISATRELLSARLDATFPRPTLIRLWETSGGNPSCSSSHLRKLAVSQKLGLDA
jgi:hypothetical protein